MQLNKEILKYTKYFLFPISLCYGIVIYCRNFLYNIGLFKSYKLPCTTISIGNLSIGGTGKTPTVIYLAELLQKKNKNIIILSRGYGRTSRGTIVLTNDNINYTWKDVGDEPYLMSKILNDIPIIVDKNRFRGGMIGIKKFNPDIILLDDGFQHRSIARDLDLCLINAKESKSDHNLIPIGVLREPWFNIDRANAIILTKSNIHEPSPFLLKKIKGTNKTFIKSSFNLLNSSLHNKADLKPEKNKKIKVAILSAIGDNSGFYNSIVKLGYEIVCEITFKDHFHYTKKTLNSIKKKILKSDSKFIITTEKDWIKIEHFNFDREVIVVKLAINMEPQDKLNRLLEPFL